MSITWNTAFEASPSGGDSPALGDDRIREIKEAVRERLNHEHKMDLAVGDASLDGWHEKGSAVSYIQATAPTTRPDGVTVLSALDDGRLWVDTDSKEMYVYVNSSGWIPVVVAANKGKIDVTLSNYDNDSAPVVKAGSVFDVGGVLIEVIADATPTGYAGIPVSTTFYLYWDKSAGSFIYSSIVPTWSDALQGWYNGNDRALFSMYKDSGGTLYQFKSLMINVSSSQISGDLRIDGINTGYGLTDVYPMNQAVRTTDNVSFASINTGHGANELYPMNQSVRTVDNVTFATVNTGYGAHDIYPPDTFSAANIGDANYTLPSLAVGQTGFNKLTSHPSSNKYVYLPSGGTYAYSSVSFYTNSNDFRAATSGNNVPGGTSVANTASDPCVVITSYKRLA